MSFYVFQHQQSTIFQEIVLPNGARIPQHPMEILMMYIVFFVVFAVGWYTSYVNLWNTIKALEYEENQFETGPKTGPKTGPNTRGRNTPQAEEPIRFLIPICCA